MLLPKNAPIAAPTDMIDAMSDNYVVFRWGNRDLLMNGKMQLATELVYPQQKKPVDPAIVMRQTFKKS